MKGVGGSARDLFFSECEAYRCIKRERERERGEWVDDKRAVPFFGMCVCVCVCEGIGMARRIIRRARFARMRQRKESALSKSWQPWLLRLRVRRMRTDKTDSLKIIVYVACVLYMRCGEF